VSAVLREELRLAPMRKPDLAEVLAIEEAIYSHPWTRGNFADSLEAGHQCWTWRRGAELVGYFVLAAGAGEAHLLNLSIAQRWQRQGLGARLLAEAIRIAREAGAARLILEVRPSNAAALRLYRRAGLREVGLRRAYYPAHEGREDAIVMEIAL
jgi:ribosomal-protein-alanine N-acetyltransferase